MSKDQFTSVRFDVVNEAFSSYPHTVFRVNDISFSTFRLRTVTETDPEPLPAAGEVRRYVRLAASSRFTHSITYRLTFHVSKEMVFARDFAVDEQTEDSAGLLDEATQESPLVSLNAQQAQKIFFSVTGLPKEATIYSFSQVKPTYRPQCFVDLSGAVEGRGDFASVRFVGSSLGWPAVVRVSKHPISKSLKHVLAYQASGSVYYSVLKKASSDMQRFIIDRIDVSQQAYALTQSANNYSDEEILIFLSHVVDAVAKYSEGEISEEGKALVHRDIKPANMLMTYEGKNPQLSDIVAELGDPDFVAGRVDEVGASGLCGPQRFMPGLDVAKRITRLEMDVRELCRMCWMPGVFPVFATSNMVNPMLLNDRNSWQQWRFEGTYFRGYESDSRGFSVFINRDVWNSRVSGSNPLDVNRLMLGIVCDRFMGQHPYLLPFLDTTARQSKRKFEIQEVRVALILERFGLLRYLFTGRVSDEALVNGVSEAASTVVPAVNVPAAWSHVHLPKNLVVMLVDYYRQDKYTPLLKDKTVRKIIAFHLQQQNNNHPLVCAFLEFYLAIHLSLGDHLRSATQHFKSVVLKGVTSEAFKGLWASRIVGLWEAYCQCIFAKADEPEQWHQKINKLLQLGVQDTFVTSSLNMLYHGVFDADVPPLVKQGCLSLLADSLRDGEKMVVLQEWMAATFSPYLKETVIQCAQAHDKVDDMYRHLLGIFKQFLLAQSEVMAERLSTNDAVNGLCRRLQSDDFTLLMLAYLKMERPRSYTPAFCSCGGLASENADRRQLFTAVEGVIECFLLDKPVSDFPFELAKMYMRGSAAHINNICLQLSRDNCRQMDRVTL